MKNTVKTQKVQPLVAAYANRSKKEIDLIKKANKPEILWESIFYLLSDENAKKLKAELKAMGIKIGKDAICSIHSNDEFAVATDNGVRPFIQIGNKNFVLGGTVDDKPCKVMLASGRIPANTKIYADLTNDKHIFVAFPESNVKKFKVKELV